MPREEEEEEEERGFSPQNIFSHNLKPYPSARGRLFDGRAGGLPFRSLSSSPSSSASSSRACLPSSVPVESVDVDGDGVGARIF